MESSFAYVGGGASQKANAIEPVRKPLASEMDERIHACVERVLRIAEKVDEHADRLVGEIPSTAEKVGVGAQAGVMGTIDSLQHAISAAENAVRRL